MPLLFLIQGFSNISSWTQNEPKSACIFMKILPICPPVLIPANIILVQSLCRNHYFKMMCSTNSFFIKASIWWTIFEKIWIKRIDGWFVSDFNFSRSWIWKFIIELCQSYPILFSTSNKNRKKEFWDYIFLTWLEYNSWSHIRPWWSVYTSTNNLIVVIRNHYKQCFIAKQKDKECHSIYVFQ